ncbi:MAG TPA: chemotaxis protein CheA, partial [Ruminococcaceae bacterium]|nr:chemotaxis protein CheA [Oscillospiraceae bacterium]
FRIMHTIKGSSAMMQFNSLATITHKMEDLFFYVRENGISPEYNEPLVDLMFKSGDFLKAEVEKVENNQPLTTDIGTLEQEINDFLKKISGKEPEDGKPAAAPQAPAAEKQPAAVKTEKTADGKPDAGHPYPVRVFFEEETEMVNLRALLLVQALKEAGFPAWYFPGDLDTNPGSADVIAKEGFLLSFSSEEERKASLKTIENFVYTKNYTVLGQVPAGKPEESGAKPEENKTKQGAVPQNNVVPHPAVKQNLINVNLSKLDNLMDLMGEIVITESMVTANYAAQNAEAGLDSNYTKSSRQLRKLTDELQGIVMSIRMVPISGVFQRMRRIVRDMSKKLDKDVELVLVGEDTEVDKSIIDNIGDPIMHVVRNAMDHGIETKEERAQTDKSPRGTITLSAQNTGGEILISIQDDGNGIDKAAVLRKAKQQGMLKKNEKDYSTREIYNFLLMPGFSTNDVVTEYSGRGVGMDVVKKNVEKIGGDVNLTSEEGKGTKVLFKIPLTLAIVNGMKVSVGDTMFIVPINNIKQLVKIGRDQLLYDTNGKEIVTMRKQYYPLIRLCSAFDITPGTKDVSEGIALLVENHEKTYCILADSLMGEQQVVVKGLPAYLTQFDIKESGISGCAILGDGSICLILDILNLYNYN